MREKGMWKSLETTHSKYITHEFASFAEGKDSA
jgi:hypothetical protein